MGRHHVRLVGKDAVHSGTAAQHLQGDEEQKVRAWPCG
ncbi:hypothetical protein amrb99_36620 [Actinomadura sp. RB99]|nr:hypothetical protein [Actinomadura sp. RB99]